MIQEQHIDDIYVTYFQIDLLRARTNYVVVPVHMYVLVGLKGVPRSMIKYKETFRFIPRTPKK